MESKFTDSLTGYDDITAAGLDLDDELFELLFLGPGKVLKLIAGTESQGSLDFCMGDVDTGDKHSDLGILDVTDDALGASSESESTDELGVSNTTTDDLDGSDAIGGELGGIGGTNIDASLGNDWRQKTRETILFGIDGRLEEFSHLIKIANVGRSVNSEGV